MPIEITCKSCGHMLYRAREAGEVYAKASGNMQIKQPSEVFKENYDRELGKHVCPECKSELSQTATLTIEGDPDVYKDAKKDDRPTRFDIFRPKHASNEGRTVRRGTANNVESTEAKSNEVNYTLKPAAQVPSAQSPQLTYAEPSAAYNSQPNTQSNSAYGKPNPLQEPEPADDGDADAYEAEMEEELNTGLAEQEQDAEPYENTGNIVLDMWLQEARASKAKRHI